MVQPKACPLGGLARAEGQALIEFALVLPLILLLVFGIIDFGRAFNYTNDLTSMANAAARLASVNSCAPCGTPGTPGFQPIEAYVKSTADSPELRDGTNGSFGISPPGATVTFCRPSATTAVGDPVKAIVQANYRWLPWFSFGAVTLKASVIQRLEQAYKSPYYYGPGAAGLPAC